VAGHGRHCGKQATGELKFLGRKSELIVTAAGVNIHPEDLEGAIEQEPGIAGCAVVPVETPSGPEAFAVIAVRGAARQAAEAVEHANEKLAEFQRVRRWAVWPEPDLPRTSTGKVRRKSVAAWVAGTQSPTDGRKPIADAGHAANEDWLLALIAATTGETPSGSSDDLRLSEDLYLDSLGRLQLAAALEERLGALPDSHALDEVRTLGELRRLVGGENERHADQGSEIRKQGPGNRELGNREREIGEQDQVQSRASAETTGSGIAQGFVPGRRNHARRSTFIPVGRGGRRFDGSGPCSWKQWHNRWCGSLRIRALWVAAHSTLRNRCW
jgi:acyl carrier protein